MEVHEVPLYFNESRDVTLKWNKAKDLFSTLLVVEQLRTIERVGVPKCKCGQVWTEILRAATQRHSEGYRTLVVPAWYIATYIK
jgi:hypothetical protein